ncbi:MAG: hypothetical protein V4773_04890 [Verrucomicrobiota bacterium]
MPTPNFTHDNTAPTAVTRPNETPSNTPPGDVTVLLPAHSNTPPAGVSLSVMAGTTSEPTAVTYASQTPSNTPPGGVTVSTPAYNNGLPTAISRADQTPNDTPPGGVARADQTPGNTPPGAVAVPTPVYDNTAPSGIARADQTPINGAPGAVPVSGTNGTQSTPQPIGYTPALGALTNNTMHTPSLHFTGNLALNQVFGLYKAPAACAITGVQLATQKAPVGADVVIDLVDADGVSLARTATLPAGQSFAAVNFGTPLPLLNAAIVRAKIAQTGTGNNPGAYLTANLIVQLT